MSWTFLSRMNKVLNRIGRHLFNNKSKQPSFPQYFATTHPCLTKGPKIKHVILTMKQNSNIQNVNTVLP